MWGSTSLIVLVLPFVGASWWQPYAKSSAASSAGSTVVATFPPSVTETFNASSAFPGPSVVGFGGPTRTGDEAEAIATAPVAAPVESYFPLVNPPTLGHGKMNVPRYWGNLSPWFSIPSRTFGLPKASPQIPEGCELNSVHLWHRHGARYPTGGAAPATVATKIHNATKTGFFAKKDLEFLNTWTYKLGQDLLTPFGRRQLFDLGLGFRVKYGDLLKNFTALPVFRTESQNRMVHSALNFAAGFFGVPEYTTDYHQLITIEGPGFNNTGAPYYTCLNDGRFGNLGSNQSAIWISKYLQPALKRLQPQIKGVNLTISDLFGFQQLCAYETVALGYSAFCDLFTVEEWKGFEYANDLNFWYSFSFGSPIAAAQGMGYVQELVARLTHTRIETHNTTTNATIDDSEVTMPLNQPIYVDATHEIVISTLLVALNMTSLAAGGSLPTDYIPKTQSFVASHVVPFATNLVGQVLSCPASSTPSHIRFVLNDGVLPLTGIKGCQLSPDGLCELDTFVAAMKERIRDVDFAFDCLANYNITDPTKITDGRPPPSVRPTPP